MLKARQAAFLVTVLFAGYASADESTEGAAFFAGVVPVTSTPGDASVVDLAQKLERLIANELARSTKRRVAPYAELLRLRAHGYEAFAPDTDFDAAVQAFGRGLVAFRALDFAKAVAEFSAARAAYEAGLYGLRDYAGYLRALSYQLVAATTAGDAKLADDAATRLFTVRPNHQVEAGLLSGAARRAAESARAKVAAASSGRIVIATSPGNATVYLNGERRDDCRTPCTLESLPPGSHAVIVAISDHAVERRRVDVAVASASALKLVLAPDARKVALRALREQLVRPVVREAFSPASKVLLNAVRAPAVVVGALAPKAKAGRGLRFAFADASRTAVKIVYGEIDADLLEGAELAEKLRAWLEDPGRRDDVALTLGSASAPAPATFDFRTSMMGLHDREQIVITPPVPDSPKVYEKWWFWTAIGAVVTGGVVTILATKKTETVVGPAANTIVLSVPP
ncbi:MAG: PEGA domain-containing protein [Deltaproteobacteria bacterium]|nr:PEGA domain-containing protein [Deltaproteobacteria bacterium]